MARNVNQFRPKGQPDAPAYSPQRDLAYIYAPMLTEVFAGLDEPNWQDYFKGWLEATGVTEENLGQGVGCFVEAHRLFIRDREVDTPEDALEKAGFMELPNPVRVLIFERIGEVVMGGWFVALRDVTMQGHEAPQHLDIADFVAAGRCLAQRLSGHAPRDDESIAEDLARMTVLREETARTLRQSQEEVDRLNREIYQLDNLRGSAQVRMDKAETIYNVAKEAATANWLKRSWMVAKLAWKILRKQVE